MTTKKLAISLALFSSLSFGNESGEWTPAKCHLHGTFIAYKQKDTLAELRHLVCQNGVAQARKKLEWDNNCSSIAMMACMAELDISR